MPQPSQDSVAPDFATPRPPTAFSLPRRAFVIGGSGLIGRVISRRLLAAGWSVDVVGRDAENMPRDITAAGARFHQLDRSDDAALRSAFGGARTCSSTASATPQPTPERFYRSHATPRQQ